MSRHTATWGGKSRISNFEFRIVLTRLLLAGGLAIAMVVSVIPAPAAAPPSDRMLAGPNSPQNPVANQTMWFDTSTGALKIWTGTQWDGFTTYHIDSAMPTEGGTGQKNTYAVTGQPEIRSGTWSASQNDFNVKAFGAVGNGVANDTSAIQAAITAAGVTGGIVYFPAGTYLVSTLTLASNVGLVGAGVDATILYQVGSTNAPVIDLLNRSNASVFNLTVNGNAANQNQAGTSAGIASSGATNVILGNVLTTNTADWGFGLYAITGATLWNVRSTGMRAGASAGATRAGILLGSSAGGTNAIDVTIMGCRITSSGAFVNGLMLEKGSNIRVSGCSTAVAYTGFKIKTSHTTVTGSESYGGAQGFQTQDAIQNLILSGNRAHFAQGSGFFFSVPAGTARDWVISGNTAFDNGKVGATTSYGFAFELTAGAVLDRLVFTGNIATSQGRGVSFTKTGSITNAIVANNNANDNTADWVNAGSLAVTTLTLGPNIGLTGDSAAFVAPSGSHSLQFWVDNVAQGTSATLTNGISARGYLMTRAGYLRALHAKSNDAVIAGQVKFVVQKNGGNLGNGVVIKSGTFNTRLETPQEQVFAAGDMITCIYVANGALLPAGTADFDVVAEVVYP